MASFWQCHKSSSLSISIRCRSCERSVGSNRSASVFLLNDNYTWEMSAKLRCGIIVPSINDDDNLIRPSSLLHYAGHTLSHKLAPIVSAYYDSKAGGCDQHT